MRRIELRKMILFFCLEIFCMIGCNDSQLENTKVVKESSRFENDQVAQGSSTDISELSFLKSTTGPFLIVGAVYSSALPSSQNQTFNICYHDEEVQKNIYADIPLGFVKLALLEWWGAIKGDFIIQPFKRRTSDLIKFEKAKLSNQNSPSDCTPGKEYAFHIYLSTQIRNSKNELQYGGVEVNNSKLNLKTPNIQIKVTKATGDPVFDRSYSPYLYKVGLLMGLNSTASANYNSCLKKKNGRPHDRSVMCEQGFNSLQTDDKMGANCVFCRNLPVGMMNTHPCRAWLNSVSCSDLNE